MIKLILISLFLLSSCFKKGANGPAHVIKTTEIPADFMIPLELLKMVESDLLIESKILSPVFIYVPLEVQFNEKTPSTLMSPVLKFSFPKGGGTIDLAKIVTGQGSFSMSFPPEQFKDLPLIEHVFYMSESPKKKIGDEEFGLGCGKWIDLKDRFENLTRSDFLYLNTTDNRHLFVLAGHYVLVFRKLNQIFMTQVTILDSKNSVQLCPQVKGASL